MRYCALVLVCSLTTAWADDARPAAPLVFRGTFAPAGSPQEKAPKSFDLTLWARNVGQEHEVSWIVDERGRGAWPWVFRCGRQKASATWQAEGVGPSLLFDRDGAASVVPLPLPLLSADKPLAEGAEWSAGRLQYRVEKDAKQGDRNVWQIAARDPFGRRRQLALSHDSPLVLAIEDQRTIGQGEEHVLKIEWVSGDLAGAGEPPAALAGLLKLRERLSLGEPQQRMEWKPEQLAVLKELLPAIAATAVGTPVERLIRQAERDLSLQSERSRDVGELSAKAIGGKLPELNLATLTGEQLTSKQLEGKVTVLHFWEYRDEPLKEPYGQVGYLDFLYQRRQKQGLEVYGVAVDGRLADEATAAAAKRGVRKLRDFMNVSYPLALDSGKLLAQVGDPRPLGATLPLYVVVGRDGRIAHFHVGFYEVQRDRGLADLDAAVGRALDGK